MCLRYTSSSVLISLLYMLNIDVPRYRYRSNMSTVVPLDIAIGEPGEETETCFVIVLERITVLLFNLGEYVRIENNNNK
jgi:hypothetical protein